MQFFVDTADVKQIEEINKWFLLDGVTTNPTLMAKEKSPSSQIILDICKIIKKGPVSAEVLATDSEEMIKEAKTLKAIHPQVIIKLPLIEEGLKATAVLKEQNVLTNLTLCFSTLQALLAAKAGASYVSIFVGRLDDIGVDGMEVVSQTIQLFTQYGLKTKVLVASVRNISHILSAGLLGADAITIPPFLFSQMLKHPLTDKGLIQFLKSAGKI